MISVEIRAPDLTIVPQWDALARRASPNVFMHPIFLGISKRRRLDRVRNATRG